MVVASAIRAGRAFVELFADNSKLVAGLRAARAKIRAFGQSIRAMGMKLTAIGTGMLTPLLGAAKLFASMGDSVAKMAKRTGVSVEALSELKFAAEQSGTQIEDLENGLRRMQRVIHDAGNGMKSASDALAQFGLSADDLKNLSPEQQFKLLGEVISRIEDPTTKAALAMQVFGRSGTQLLPMFERGVAGIEELQAEARRLGLTMGREDAQAAEQFTDALNKLWNVVKMGAFRIGAALAPALQNIAERITSLVVRVSAWINENRHIIVTIAGVAAAAIAGGVALVALGGIIGALSSAIGVLITVMTAAVAVLKIVIAIVTFLVSPIGLVIAAVAALGVYILYATGAISKALKWLGDKFNILKEDALASFAGISDALAAGDIGLAMRILWLTLKMEWTRGVNFLEKAWLGFRNFFIRIGYDAWHGMLALVETVWHTIEMGWIDTTAFFSRIWNGFVSFFARTWEDMKAIAAKSWAWIKSWFDSSVNLDVVYREVDAQREAAVAEIGDKQMERELRHLRERERAQRQHQGTMAEIGRQNLAKHQELDTEYTERMAENEKELSEARREWQEAIGTARERRAAMDKADAGPGALESPDDILARANKAMQGLGNVLAEEVEKISARGTFYAAHAVGLQAGDATDRMANGIDKIEKNTRSLRNVDELAFT